LSNLKFAGVQAIILPDTPTSKVNGIIIPDEARKPTNTGTIISVAPNEDIKKGDKVGYNHRTGYTVEYGGQKYLSIHQNNILSKDMIPLHSRVFVEPIKAEQTLSEGGVVLLEDSATRDGKVVAVGCGKPDDKMMLEVGDIVTYPKNAGTEIKGLLLLNQADIMCITERFPVDEPND
jgi:co-chaperonin GroES (HSP10)